ncbi:TPA: ATP synthase F1 subunit gamma [Candidatus Acetothermia bacterium]|nr:ATP synthase F1 subunit gamma [Candidatus Acetothermia bacterium]
MAIAVRAIKDRIGNIENIRQITRAMNAIAMTKVTRMKRRLGVARPYMAALEAFLAALLSQIGEGTGPHPLTIANGSPYVGILVLNADRGLCGRFKGDLNRKGYDLLKELDERGRVLAGGEKARAYFARQRVEMLTSYVHLYENPTPTMAQKMTSDLISLYIKGKVGRVVVVGMQFISDLAQRIVVEEILPIRVEARGPEALVEPDLADMLDFTLPLYLQGKLFSVLLETKTSEHAIRRQAMKNATDNADDLLKTLTRTYNKARQQSITREIADIMGGAEALRD